MSVSEDSEDEWKEGDVCWAKKRGNWCYNHCIIHLQHLFYPLSDVKCRSAPRHRLAVDDMF